MVARIVAAGFALEQCPNTGEKHVLITKRKLK